MNQAFHPGVTENFGITLNSENGKISEDLTSILIPLDTEDKKEDTLSGLLNSLLQKKRTKGRPEKYGKREEIEAKNKFKKFLLDEDRTKNGSEKIELEKIKDKFSEIYEIIDKSFTKNNKCKYKEILHLESIDSESKESFKQLILENWEKEKDEFFSKNSEENENIKKYTLDQSIFLFLKDISGKVCEDYFFFVLKYILFLREYINSKKKKENKKCYSQIYPAEVVNEISNDFFITFLEFNNLLDYFKFEEKKEELIELNIYFSYWFYKEHHTTTHLSLRKKKKKLKK